MTDITAKTPIVIDFAPMGGGLRAWVLACFDVVYPCID